MYKISASLVASNQNVIFLLVTLTYTTSTRNIHDQNDSCITEIQANIYFLQPRQNATTGHALLFESLYNIVVNGTKSSINIQNK